MNPVIIMKDNKKRGHFRNCKGYKWLVVMELDNSDSLKVFNYFLPLIDVDRDCVYGLTVIHREGLIDDIEGDFNKIVAQCGVSKDRIAYDKQYYRKSFTKEIVKNLVNHNEEHYFDFVMFYNNPEKYKMLTKDKSENYHMCEQLMSNICFVNGLYAK